MKFRFKFTILLSLSTLLFFNCSTTPVYLSNQYATPIDHEEDGFEKHPTKNCVLNIISIEDHRKNKQTLGKVAGRAVYNKNIVEWLASGFDTLNDHGYKVTFENELDSDLSNVLNMSIKLRILSVHNISTSKSASLVLSVSYSDNVILREEKIYRSAHTNVNWISSENEINTIFNITFSDILNKISRDAEIYCGSSENII